MRSVLPAFRRSLHAAAATLVLALGAATFAAVDAVPSAHADEEAPLKAGTTLVARGDVELQKVTIPRGARVEITATSSKSADLALPDGYVLRRVPMSRIRYFFDVAR